MPYFITYCRGWLELVFKTGSLFLASRLLSAGVWHFHLGRRSGDLWLEPLDISLSMALRWPWLLNNLNSAISLKNHAGAVFGEHEGHLGIELQGVKLVAGTGEELFTANEVFVQNVYRFFPRLPVVVLDIGMNVGYASLQFASMPQVTSVFSFEPFPQTYEQALTSIRLNPACAAKIHAENVGVAGSSREVIAPYDTNLKGSSSVYARPETGALSSEHIRLRNAVEVLDGIIAARPGLTIVAKIDCEGAEYEIIEAWTTSHRLARLSLIMIEWHRMTEGQEPLQLCKQLGDAGFDIFAGGNFSEKTGMIYAARTASLTA